MGKPTNPAVDIMALAAEAKRKGYSDPDRLIERLREIITRGEGYINRPYRQGRPFNDTVHEDDQVLAYLIVLLETLKEEETNKP